MIREYVLKKLRSEFGAPRANDASEWWIVGQHRHNPLHICLNERAEQDAAHVLIFDPDCIEGRNVIEARIESIEDADTLCECIRNIANPDEGSPLAQANRLRFRS